MTLPRSTLDTKDLPPAMRYEAWRDGCSVLVGYDMLEDARHGNFRARLDNHLIDQCMLTEFMCPAGHHERSASRIARDGADLIMINLFVRGTMDFRGAEHRGVCGAGEMVVVDYSRPVSSDHLDQSNIVLAVPRAALADRLGPLDALHLQVLPAQAAMSHLLRSHLLSLRSQVSRLEQGDARQVCDMSLALAAAAIQAALGQRPDDSDGLRASMRARADTIIERELRSPNLSPATLARALPCSRSRLFALYKNEGGVARFIQKRRLRAALRELTGLRWPQRAISTIAYDYGFNHVPSFNRAFKAEFGLTPGEARGEAAQLISVAGRSRDTGRAPSLEHEAWILDMLSSH